MKWKCKCKQRHKSIANRKFLLLISIHNRSAFTWTLVFTIAFFILFRIVSSIAVGPLINWNVPEALHPTQYGSSRDSNKEALAEASACKLWFTVSRKKALFYVRFHFSSSLTIIDQRWPRFYTHSFFNTSGSGLGWSRRFPAMQPLPKRLLHRPA